jgi:hypothetical protein
MGKSYLRLISDVHGYYEAYVKLAEQAEYSIQLGDLGFDYDCLEKFDTEHHKVLAGNHDNYARWGTTRYIYMNTAHWLGDYGVYNVPGIAGDFFFVRGGYSIDWRYRIPERSWFEDEELSPAKLLAAIELYEKTKPRFVISHECPEQIIQPCFGPFIWDGELIKPSRTAIALGQMFTLHKPEQWIFGHYHKDLDVEILGTRFRCRVPLGYIDIDKEIDEEELDV